MVSTPTLTRIRTLTSTLTPTHTLTRTLTRTLTGTLTLTRTLTGTLTRSKSPSKSPSNIPRALLLYSLFIPDSLQIVVFFYQFEVHNETSDPETRPDPLVFGGFDP